jgi:hypothetical protein
MTRQAAVEVAARLALLLVLAWLVSALRALLP